MDPKSWLVFLLAFCFDVLRPRRLNIYTRRFFYGLTPSLWSFRIWINIIFKTNEPEEVSTQKVENWNYKIFLSNLLTSIYSKSEIWSDQLKVSITWAPFNGGEKNRGGGWDFTKEDLSAIQWWIFKHSQCGCDGLTVFYL